MDPESCCGSQNYGYLFSGVPIIRVIVFWGLKLGSQWLRCRVQGLGFQVVSGPGHYPLELI